MFAKLVSPPRLHYQAEMADPSIDALRRAAETDDVAALTRFGRRLLDETEPDAVAEAALVLDRATHLGGTEAPAMLAPLFAVGAGAPQNWKTALDLLQIAAERGSSSAQGQLAALADAERVLRGVAPEAPERWRRLRVSIDVPSWSRAGPQVVLHPAPRISRYDNFISPAVCAWLIGRAEGRVTPARVFHPVGGEGLLDQSRSNSALEFKLADMDVVLAMLRFRVAAVVGVQPADLEAPQVLHYRVGQRFERHYDFLDADLPGHTRELAERGQRIITFLIYLNGDFDGGETDFPLLDQRCKPPAGGALCFVNIDPAGAPDRRTLHAGLTPTRGEKWLFSQWIRRPPIR